MENLSQSKGDVGRLLDRHGIKPTRQRVAIAGVLFGRCGHFSADEVMAMANADGAGVSKATVYNTLRVLCGHGLVREVIADPTRIFYDANMTPHHHFYDVDSGQLTDIDASGVTVTGLPPLPSGAIAEGIEVVVRVRRAR